MAKIISALIAYLCFNLFSTPLFGQSLENVSVNFKVFGIGKDSYTGLYYHNGSEVLPLNFHKVYRSVNNYSYSGSPEITFLVKNPDYSPEIPESPEFIKIASILVKESLDDALILFSAHPDNRNVPNQQRSFETYILDDSIEYFSRNTLIVFNATGALLYGKIDDINMTVNAGLTEPIPYKSKSGGSSNKIGFALATNGGVRLAMSNDIKLPDGRRILLILERPLQRNSFRIQARILSETVPDKP